ncbi:MAG: hypothetical protein ACI358_01745 [Candidatus Limimorpha sp.]
MRRFYLSLITILMLSTSICSAQRINFIVRGALGYGFSNSELRGILAYKAGDYADFLLFNPIAIESGVEIKSTGLRTYSGLGGLTGASDFTEKFKYRLSYMAIPLCIKLQNEGEWYDGIYAGVGINFPIVGTTTYKRTGTGLNGVDEDGRYKINNLKSPVISSKIGFDQKISYKLGIYFEIENLYAPFDRASNSSLTICETIYLGITYYL